ncbi:peptidase associated/transthyretin-like domain-containing protein [Algoriphagus boritolerans]|uniref:CarboxypepD_reg-like domain-containing protein n=1 Tax=Algoriphagus boritolerans DSM 17298 = JCM 18970 TaxID=1120964 RepID=A0A1H5TJB2_9BACT|nr:hypothetical protein [Algoriphagus boritolerans]SEF62854.1 hypothetical protein SAMN03080598_00790 [Algoriphagus boritolerans DSM 17298 = JCM 18970]
MKGLILLLCFGLLTASAICQTSYSGNVLDSFDKKYLEGVTVSIKGKESVLTNPRGYFSIQGMMGDTLVLSFAGFYDQQVILGSDRFMLLQIQDRARLLPTFQVDAEPYRFRFKDGKLYLSENEPDQEKSLSQNVSMGIGTSNGSPGVAIYGAISYFTKRNTQLRRYAQQLEWIKRREGYLEVIDSDSIRTELMASYELDRDQWDQLIIRFNQFHLQHEFLDWSKDRVLTSLKEFIRIESYLMD